MTMIRQGLVVGAICWACSAPAATLEDERLTVDAAGYEAAGAVTVTNVTFTAAATISGAGCLNFETSASAPGEIFVPEGVTAVFEVPVTNATGGTIRKTGPGTLELTKDDDLQRFVLVAGGLRLVGGVHKVVKLSKDGSQPVTLHVDGAELNTTGYLDAIFASATIGAGGFTLRAPDTHTYISPSFTSAPGVEKDGGLTLAGGTIVFQGKKNSFTGGIQVKGDNGTSGQFRFKGESSLGTGPISVISGNDSSWMEKPAPRSTTSRTPCASAGGRAWA